MTRFWNIIISFAAIFTLVLTGCHHGSATMQELAAIDSTLTVSRQYETALHRLDSLQPDSFNKEERAYYSLLLTQVHYKCFVDDTTDSVINIAVDYYKNSSDHEKRTRSLIYQGAVYEVMGDLEKAVESYKKADETADESDLENKAYANLRLGVLYQSQIVGANTIALDKLKEALSEYKKVGDKHYEIVCFTSIGGLYRNIEEKQDSAVLFLKEAIELAKNQNDQYHIFANLFLLSEYYYVRKHDYQTAKKYGLQAVSVDQTIIDHPRAHYRLASSYLFLGQADSALYYLKNAPVATVAMDSIVYFELMSELEHLHWKDDGKSRYYIQLAHSIADSLTMNGLNHRLRGVEKKYDLQLAELNKVKYQSRWRGALLVVALLALLALALTFLVWRYRNQLKMKQNETELLKADLDDSLASLQQVQKQLDTYEQQVGNEKKQQSDELRAIISQQIDAVHQLMVWSYQFDSEKFASKFKEMMSLPGATHDSTYWSNLQTLVNDLHDNILNKAQEAAGGTLSDSELNLLALYCCGFSRTVIMVAMGYKHIGTVYNKKFQIAQKLHVTDLDDFIAPFQEKINKREA